MVFLTPIRLTILREEPLVAESRAQRLGAENVADPDQQQRNSINKHLLHNWHGFGLTAFGVIGGFRADSVLIFWRALISSAKHGRGSHEADRRNLSVRFGILTWLVRTDSKPDSSSDLQICCQCWQSVTHDA